MSRSAAHVCGAAGCGNLRDRWATVCRACWRRLPQDLRGAIKSAKEAKAPHLVAAADIAAKAWLGQHPVAAEIAKRIGERDHTLPP